MILVFFILLSYPQLAYSQQHESGLLYKIEGNGLHEPSYIFGTMHLIPKKDFFLDKSVIKALEKVENITFEADIFSMSLSDKVTLAKKMLLPEGENLKNLLGDEYFNKLMQFAKDSCGIKPNQFETKYNRLTPFAVSSILTSKYMGKTKSYEEELYQKAKKRKLEVKALETVEMQVNLINQLPLNLQVSMLLDLENMIELKEMIALYKKGNLEALYNEFGIAKEDESEEMLKFNDLLLDDRNAKWMEKMPKMLSSSNFIAVGALHLPGEKGMLNLLRNAGYKVSVVNN